MRPLRRSKYQLPDNEVVRILQEGEYGILSTCGLDKEPYGTPVNYVYRDGIIYFHCANEGRKIDNIKENNLVGFTVVGKTQIIPSKYSTAYESVIVSGEARILPDIERSKPLLALMEKYSADFLKGANDYIQRHLEKTTVIEIKITDLKGKRNPG